VLWLILPSRIQLETVCLMLFKIAVVAPNGLQTNYGTAVEKAIHFGHKLHSGLKLLELLLPA